MLWVFAKKKMTIESVLLTIFHRQISTNLAHAIYASYKI